MAARTTARLFDPGLKWYPKVYGLLYTSGSESDYYSDTESNFESEVKLLDFSDNDNIMPTNCDDCTGDNCKCKTDEFYKLQSQFEDSHVKTISSENVIDLLKEISDENIRSKILDMASTSS